MPLKRSLNTVIAPVPPINSATVTADPSKSVRARVVPLSVNVTGSVAVVPVGISFDS